MTFIFTSDKITSASYLQLLLWRALFKINFSKRSSDIYASFSKLFLVPFSQKKRRHSLRTNQMSPVLFKTFKKFNFYLKEKKKTRYASLKKKKLALPLWSLTRTVSSSHTRDIAFVRLSEFRKIIRNCLWRWATQSGTRKQKRRAYWGVGRRGGGWEEKKMSEITFCVWEKRSQLECAATR